MHRGLTLGLLGVAITGLVLALIHLLGGPLMSQTSRGHAHELKHPDGSWIYTNKLAGESSPYLLQHAHNPVNWYAWGPQAFQLARETGKPIFLSVGYSTCYWCHVMEREVFENPKLAELMNRHLINIKVDREERPDVDDVYMTALQMLTGSGGWPMSVFLTPPGAAGPDDPGLKPFHAGTYIPPESRPGMPGFGQLIEEVDRAWGDQRPQLIERAAQVAAAVTEHLTQKDEPKPLDIGLVQQTTGQLLQMYEPENGGFSTAPKFPQPAMLMFLLRVHANNQNAELLKAISYTLERMAQGGMYDQIGGGFHRYSTDGQWLVPHFEKMLYDNGQLVETYLKVQAQQPYEHDPDFYRRVVRQVCDYVLREMVDPTGAFWSAQDAEVEAREGGNYVWTPDQIREVIDEKDLGNLALKMYGLDAGTNFQDPHHPHAPPTNVLFLPQPLEQLAAEHQIPFDQFLERKHTIDQRLLARRQQRPQPATDDKVLVSWNGLMIGAMAMAGRELDEPRYTDAATRAAEAIVKHMTIGDTGALYRTMRQGQAKIPALLSDYAFFVHGLLELYRTSQTQRWLESAVRLTKLAQQQFAAGSYGGGYYDTLADQSDLFVRVRSTYDGAIASGNSQMIHNLLDLFELTDDLAYLDRAHQDLASFAAALGRQGPGMVHMHHALLRAIEAAPQRFDAAPAPKRPDADKLAIELTPEQVDLTEGPATVRVRLTVAQPYHLNAHDPGIEGLIPVKLTLADAEQFDLKATYPPGQPKKFPFADGSINVYEGSVTLEATLSRRSQNPHTPALKQATLILQYQMCTDRTCLLPQVVQLPVALR